MPDINDAAHYLTNHRKNQQEWRLDGHLVQIKYEDRYQQILLFFADDLQESFEQKLAEIMQLNAEIDSRFALIYDSEKQFGLQAFLPNQLPASTFNDPHPAARVPKKTSFSAQAKHLFLEMDDHSDIKQHSERYQTNTAPAQKPFLEPAPQIKKPSDYETPCFNVLEEMLWQVDFMRAQLG